MAEDDLARARADQLAGGLPCVVVGEMAAPGEDALLQIVGIRPGLEHVGVVVGFQQHRVAPGDVLQPALAHAADVRGQREPRRAALEAEAAGLQRVVGRGKGHDVHVA